MPTKKTNTADQPLADAARISPQQIWQAGLGAFLKAQQEGDRAFEQLVSDGSGMEVPPSWRKVEEIFEDRVARALAAMAVPTHQDLQALRDEVDALRLQVAQLSAGTPAKPAAKSAVRKRTA